MGEIKRYTTCQRGFTLLEVIVVLALMGLMAAIAGPRIGSGMQGAENRTSVRRFAAAMRAARMTAVSQRAQVLVIVELGGNTCEFKIRPAGRRRGHGVSHSLDQASGNATADDSLAIPEIFNQPLELAGDVLFLGFRQSQTDYRQDRAAVMFLPHGNSTGGSFLIGRENGPVQEVTIDTVTGRVLTRWVDA